MDAVISMQEAYSWVREHISCVTEEMDFPTSSGYGIGWEDLGEMLAAGVRGLAVDGITQVASVLEEVEKGELDYIDYIEAQACIGVVWGAPLQWPILMSPEQGSGIWPMLT